MLGFHRAWALSWATSTNRSGSAGISARFFTSKSVDGAAAASRSEGRMIWLGSLSAGNVAPRATSADAPRA